MNFKALYITIAITTMVAGATENNSSNLKLKEYELIIKVDKDLDKSKIASAVGIKSGDLLNFWSSKMLIDDKPLDEIKDDIKNYLEGIGYFKSNIDAVRDNSKIVVTIDKGRAIKIENLIINSDLNIKKIVTFKEGDNFEPTKFTEIKDKIIEKLLNRGYCHYKLDTKAYVDLDSFSAKLKYNLNKGSVCYFGDIKISNKPKDIDNKVILSRVKFRKGHKFSTKAIKDSYIALNLLNTFANIRISYDVDKNSTYVNTDVSLNKRRYLKRYSVSIGADSEVGARFKGSWEKRNFFGNAKKLTVQTEISKEKKSLDLNLFAPAFIEINSRAYLDLYSSFGYYNLETSALKEHKIKFDAHLKYEYKKLSLTAGLGIERLNLTLYAPRAGLIGGDFNLLYPYIEAVYDNRDSKLDPKNGLYLKIYSEWGVGDRKGKSQYLKYLIEARAIKSFGDLTLAAVGKIGVIHQVSGRLPASKLFLGGGVFSNRAYGRNKIGVLSSNRSFSELGGKSYLNLQLEADYRLYKELYGAVFYDRTVINAKEYNWSGNHIDTLGVGLRYKTPIGPIKLDIGFNIHNRKDHAISIMLGQSF